MSELAFEDIPISQVNEYPVTKSVKIQGTAGCGKSTQAFRRMVECAHERDVDVEDIAVISYRVDLIEELLDDLVKEVGLLHQFDLESTGGRTKYLGTAHAVAKRMLGKTDMVTWQDRKDWCNTRDWEYTGDRSLGKLFFSVNDWLVDNQVPAEEATRAPEYDDFESELGRPIDIEPLLEDWLEYKLENDLYDFSDLLTVAISEELVPDVEILVIDELHDVYPLLNDVITMWIDEIQERDGTVIVAGDTNQVINSYQGASAEFFNDIDLPEVWLGKSWRVPESHFELAKDVLSQSQEAPDVEADSDDGELSVIRSGEHLPDSQGSNNPIQLLEETLEYDYGDEDNEETVMYLARTQSQCEYISESLKESGILFGGSTGSNAWTRSESHERVALYYCLRKLSSIDESDFEVKEWDSHATFEQGADISLYTDDLREFVKYVPAEYIIGSKEELRDELKGEDSWKESLLTLWVEPEFWREFTEGADSLDNLNLNQELEAWVRPALENPDNAEVTLGSTDSQLINVRTIHASKGAEADLVILYDGITRRIHNSMFEDNEARKNEDRVWFVALTRSREKMVVVQDGFSYTTNYLNNIGDLL
ncbi:ATP-dependent helicase [Haloterrigena salifodinae]|uniref:DNA 3'-5' helicase n=1 Tax=Haloterrigena salifodinae TaxID=2675099 RepID=A0A8T8E2B7_9EURY|nr:3'-5' exonuclease [Haloterrigena salifodinae]QRV16005.1 ATP-dependent helicase [Haloterrigena salifodinae]